MADAHHTDEPAPTPARVGYAFDNTTPHERLVLRLTSARALIMLVGAAIDAEDVPTSWVFQDGLDGINYLIEDAEKEASLIADSLKVQE